MEEGNEHRKKRDVEGDSNNDHNAIQGDLEITNGTQNSFVRDTLEVEHNGKARNNQNGSESEKTIIEASEQRVESILNTNDSNNLAIQVNDLKVEAIPQIQQDDNINPVKVPNISDEEVFKDKIQMESSKQIAESMNIQNKEDKADVINRNQDKAAPAYGVQHKKEYNIPYEYGAEMIDKVKRKIYLVERALDKLRGRAQEKMFKPPEHDHKFGCNIYVYMMEFKRPTVHDVWKSLVR